ncbi:MAG: hypothetical protein R3224_02865 [Balneolaceae bacterium]|nr:hypothetical protein [Balneolaceae bacterium]
MGRALLLLVTGLFIVYGIVFKSITEREQLTGVPERSGDYLLDEQGRNVTSSLVDLAVESIEKNQNTNKDWSHGWGGSFEYQNFLGADSAYLYGFDQSMQSSSDYPGNTNVGNAGGWDEYRVLLYGTSTMSGRTTYTEVLMQQDSFSKYSYFTDNEPNYIWFMSKDTLTGPVHTNGTFHIAGDPTFNGYVSSPNDWEGYCDGDASCTDNPNFNAGSNFSAANKELPDKNGTQTAKLKNKAQGAGLYFDKPIDVEMESNGNIKILEKVDAYTTIEHNISKADYNEGVIGSSKDVNIKGTLDGRLSVYSEQNVEIMGDINYKTDPRVDSTSTDLLGIISNQSVKVDRWAHTANGSKDLTIQASVMTLQGSFWVEKYNEGSPRGEIHLLGGLIMRQRGPVGTFSYGSGIQSGYSKNYKYDTRLLADIPPFFPRESPFSIVYWRDRSDFFDKN